MAAQVLEIIGRPRPHPLGLVSVSDFDTSPGAAVDASTILRPQVSLYCIDDDRRRGIFVEAPEGVDLTAAAFYYQSQFEHARRLIAVPYEDMHRVAAGVGDPGPRLILLYSTGRCGSTLLSRAFARVPNVVSLPEPDVLTQLVGLRPTNGSRDAELRQMAATCVRLLCKPPGQTFVIKPRSVVIEIADLLHGAFPQSRPIFLYRNAADVVESSIKALGPPPTVPDTNTPEGKEQVDRYLSWLRGGTAAALARFTAGALRAAVTRGDLRPLKRILRRGAQGTAAEVYSVHWVSIVNRYLALHRRGIIPAAARYEDLAARPPHTIAAIFTAVGLSAEAAQDACRATERDSQEGSVVSRERAKETALDERERNVIRQTAAIIAGMHWRIGTPGFVAPGTLGPVEPDCVPSHARMSPSRCL